MGHDRKMAELKIAISSVRQKRDSSWCSPTRMTSAEWWCGSEGRGCQRRVGRNLTISKSPVAFRKPVDEEPKEIGTLGEYISNAGCAFSKGHRKAGAGIDEPKERIETAVGQWYLTTSSTANHPGAMLFRFAHAAQRTPLSTPCILAPTLHEHVPKPNQSRTCP
jgi:hypothetical protein